MITHINQETDKGDRQIRHDSLHHQIHRSLTLARHRTATPTQVPIKVVRPYQVTSHDRRKEKENRNKINRERDSRRRATSKSEPLHSRSPVLDRGLPASASDSYALRLFSAGRPARTGCASRPRQSLLVPSHAEQTNHQVHVHARACHGQCTVPLSRSLGWQPPRPPGPARQ
jgi:hypothetical protein